MRLKRGIVLKISLFSLLLLASCTTPYQKKGTLGGYTNQQIAKDMVQVNYRSNAYTSMEKTKQYWLRRCAEVTLEMQYKYFVILENNAGFKVSTHTTGGGPTTTYGTATTFGNQTYFSGTTYSKPTRTHTIRKPRVSGTIRLFNEKPGESEIISYDAQELLYYLKK